LTTIRGYAFHNTSRSLVAYCNFTSSDNYGNHVHSGATEFNDEATKKWYSASEPTSNKSKYWHWVGTTPTLWA